MSNVRVVCRFRPLNKREKELNCRNIITIEDSALLKIENVSKNYTFDRIFNWECNQAEVFQYAALPLVHDVMDGFNATIFAYGQTGSGKTWSMMGEAKSEKDKGIIPRLVDSIFQQIDEAEQSMEFTVKLSYVEIYMEKIRDLLAPEKTNLKIRESSRGVWIQDVTENYVVDYDSVLDNMLQGQHNRAIASTNMNLESSRSHSVFMVILGQTNKETGSKKQSKLILVDLAGSESVGKTGAAGQTLLEAKHINKSLSALGNVINALTKGSGSGFHIPYRDSKLTRLLSDSLGGNSKTCLIITCSPASDNREETVSTCRFGNRAKNIKNKPKVNVEKSVGEYKRLLNEAYRTIKQQKATIDSLQNDNKALRDVLEKNNLEIPVTQTQLPSTAKEISSSDKGINDTLKRPAAIDEIKTMDPSLKTELEERINDLEKDNEDLKEQLLERSKMIQQEKQETSEQRKDWEKKLADATEYCRNVEEIKNELDETKKTNELLKNQKQKMDSERKAAIHQHEKTKKTLEDKMAIMQMQLEDATNRKKRAERERESAITQLQVNQIPVSFQSEETNISEEGEKETETQSAEQILAGSGNSGNHPSKEHLLQILQDKCDEYLELERSFAKSKEDNITLGKQMEDERQKNIQAMRAKDQKLGLSEAKREKVEYYCKKLLESGLFWRERRRAMPQGKIVMPIQGGRGKKRSTRASAHTSKATGF